MKLKNEVWEKIKRDYFNQVYPSIRKLADAYGISEKAIRKKEWYTPQQAVKEAIKEASGSIEKIVKKKTSNLQKEVEVVKAITDARLLFRNGADTLMNAALKGIGGALSSVLMAGEMKPKDKLYLYLNTINVMGKYSSFNVLAQERHEKIIINTGSDDRLLEILSSLVAEGKEEKAKLRALMERDKNLEVVGED